jgi:hypothetical protein
MKKLLLMIGVLCIISNLALGNCLNNAPGKKHVITNAAGSKIYWCFVKNSDEKSFDNGYCKKCGCHISDHDNTAKQPKKSAKQPQTTPAPASVG